MKNSSFLRRPRAVVRLFAGLLAFSLLSGCMAGPEQGKSEESDSPGGVVVKTEFTEAEERFYLETYFEPNPFLFQSWTDPEEVEGFRFGNFYGHNSRGDPKYDAELFNIPGTMDYEIPREVLEEFVQLYFDVSIEHLRTSWFYDPDREIYTGVLNGSRGMGSWTDKLVQVTVDGDREEIVIQTFSEGSGDEYGPPTQNRLGIDHSGDHFKFFYVERTFWIHPV